MKKKNICKCECESKSLSARRYSYTLVSSYFIENNCFESRLVDYVEAETLVDAHSKILDIANAINKTSKEYNYKIESIESTF